MKFAKKIISALSALMLCISLIPVSVFADVTAVTPRDRGTFRSAEDVFALSDLTIGDTFTLGGVIYTYKGDDLSESWLTNWDKAYPSDNPAYKSGTGYILFESVAKKLTLSSADVTVLYLGNVGETDKYTITLIGDTKAALINGAVLTFTGSGTIGGGSTFNIRATKATISESSLSADGTIIYTNFSDADDKFDVFVYGKNYPLKYLVEVNTTGNASARSLTIAEGASPVLSSEGSFGLYIADASLVKNYGTIVNEDQITLCVDNPLDTAAVGTLIKGLNIAGDGNVKAQKADKSSHSLYYNDGTHQHRSRYGYEYDAESHYVVCECGEKFLIESHIMNTIIDKEATLDAEGKKHDECEVCGYKTEAVTIPKLEPASNPDTDTDPKTDTDPNSDINPKDDTVPKSDTDPRNGSDSNNQNPAVSPSVSTSPSSNVSTGSKTGGVSSVTAVSTGDSTNIVLYAVIVIAAVAAAIIIFIIYKRRK